MSEQNAQLKIIQLEKELDKVIDENENCLASMDFVLLFFSL